MKKYLLIADLDLTLLGDDDSLGRFAAWHRRRRRWLKLVYASGRPHEAMRQAISHSALPRPEALISGVGSELRCFDSGMSLPGWSDRWLQTWSRERVCAALAPFQCLQSQPDEFQSRFKISYYARRLRPALLDDLRSALQARGLRAELIYSADRYLDVLPFGVSKGAAAAFLARRWGWPTGRVLVAGDSGNDLAMFHRGFRGIVVANAHRELKALAGPRVYHSPFRFAEGVLDGLRHWLPTMPALRSAS